QNPAPVYDIQVTPSDTSAQVRWRIRAAPVKSSYITHYCIYLGQRHLQTINRHTNQMKFNILGLKPYTKYTVGIAALDGSSQRSRKIYKKFITNEAVPSRFPSNVTFTTRGKNNLTVSWRHLNKSLRNGILKGYIVCYSDKARSSYPSCSHQNAYSNATVIDKLQPATKYFVTVAAGTIAGYGPRSSEISKITNGERVNPVATSYSSLNLIITKPATNIKEVMIIVQVAPKIKKVEDIGRSDLKPYQQNISDPYVTAYLKADVLPLTFVIGDGMEYNSEKQRYANQPLEQNSSYIMFLRFFECQDSYYSTEWSVSIKTLAKPAAPMISKIISTGLKQYTISWTQQLSPEHMTILKFYGNFSAPQETIKSLDISKEMRSITVDVKFGKQYTFDIQVETEAGRSDISSESWFSHSEPLKSPEKTGDGYTVTLRKPKEEQKIRIVILVMLQLKSMSNKPLALEILNVQDSSPSDWKADNVAFKAEEFNITEFRDATMEISLREIKRNQRTKRDNIEVHKLTPGATYRIAQLNIDESGRRTWSYWSEPFTFTKVRRPAPVYDIVVTPSQYTARLTWTINARKDSSYVTKLIIFLNGTKYQNISRGTQIDIKGLAPYTWYRVEIETQDGSLQRSSKASKIFKTMNAAPNIRFLPLPYEGYIQIKDGSTWKYVKEENWDKTRQKMLCHHLGFSETNANVIFIGRFRQRHNIATGNLICYNTQPNGTFCYIHPVPSTITSNVDMPYAKCKICDKPLLHERQRKYFLEVFFAADKVFSGSGGSESYQNARFTKDGWCASMSGAYLLLDLQKEYHITQIVVMGNKDQTKWSESYSLKYSHDKTYKNSKKIKGNQNGYQASVTQLDIYNVRYMKIQSTGNPKFCLRIELCGEAQKPAPVDRIQVTSSTTWALVTSAISIAPENSSFITHYYIYRDGKYLKAIDRQNYGIKFNLTGLKPSTGYKVGIVTADSSSQTSNIKYEDFTTTH
ncbi:receptor-type tyrosine- phosphatase epsilon-like, partial [Paramuricea clavata]